jgi:hypothetical protein
MLTNNKPWVTVVNRSSTVKKTPVENTLSVVKKETSTQHDYSSFLNTKVITLKRYSFDDNGGSYQGL